MAHGLEIHYKHDWHIVRTLLWGLVVLLIGLSLWFGYRYFTKGDLPPGVSVSALQADPSVDETDVTAKQISEYRVAADEPRYISIPALSVTNTRILSVGVDSNNQLQSPANINDTAWYNKSGKPGQGYGAVLIDGHNGGVTKDGIFAKLKDLKTGDEIIIERGDGKSFTYKVVENQSMAIEDVNKTGMKMMGQSAEQGKEGLNLITCDGKWVPRIKQFDRRIMLRAVAV